MRRVSEPGTGCCTISQYEARHPCLFLQSMRSAVHNASSYFVGFSFDRMVLLTIPYNTSDPKRTRRRIRIRCLPAITHEQKTFRRSNPTPNQPYRRTQASSKPPVKGAVVKAQYRAWITHPRHLISISSGTKAACNTVSLSRSRCPHELAAIDHRQSIGMLYNPMLT